MIKTSCSEVHVPSFSRLKSQACLQWHTVQNLPQNDCYVSHGFSSKFRLVNPQIFQRGCQRLYFWVLNYYKRSLGVCLWHYIKSTLLPKLHTKDIICEIFLLTYKLNEIAQN